jgi:hypothetical protein
VEDHKFEYFSSFEVDEGLEVNGDWVVVPNSLDKDTRRGSDCPSRLRPSSLDQRYAAVANTPSPMDRRAREHR